MEKKYEPKTLKQKMAYLTEECGELISAIGKTGRWGLESSNPELPPDQRVTNRDWIIAEIADVHRGCALVYQALTKKKGRSKPDPYADQTFLARTKRRLEAAQKGAQSANTVVECEGYAGQCQVLSDLVAYLEDPYGREW